MFVEQPMLQGLWNMELGENTQYCCGFFSQTYDFDALKKSLNKVWAFTPSTPPTLQCTMEQGGHQHFSQKKGEELKF